VAVGKVIVDGRTGIGGNRLTRRKLLAWYAGRVSGAAADEGAECEQRGQE